MIRNIKRTWFEVWGEESAQNQILKGLTTLLLVCLCVETISLTVLSLRKPELIAITPAGTGFLMVTPPKEDFLKNEINRAVNGYVTSRFTWQWKEVDKAFTRASKYVDDKFTKTFLEAIQKQIKFAKEKKLSQQLYVDRVSLDLEKRNATVLGTRIILVEGLRAASPFSAQINFDYGDRNQNNPEGIYITGESIESSRDGNLNTLSNE